MKLDNEARQKFDEHVNQVLKQLPKSIHRLLEVIPLYVEDYPSRRLIQELQLRGRDELCGCFVGPTINQQMEGSVSSPGFITIFRRSLLLSSININGKIDTEKLRCEIKTTILHELAHYHGIDEEELSELGYA
ncbi:MAG: metallopeptidase family protein [Thermoguttaceae bacterium]